MQTAEKTLLLESVTGLESIKIAEVIQTSQRTIILGEELGFTPHQMGQLKQAGNLESAVTNTFEGISKNPAMLESIQRFEYAKEFLSPYAGKYMPGARVRELIHQAGIPESFRVKLSEKPGEIKYVHPKHTHESIRVMPGKLHSPNIRQQKPYIVHMRDGKALDKYGNPVAGSFD